jgi:hypothetical protein
VNKLDSNQATSKDKMNQSESNDGWSSNTGVAPVDWNVEPQPKTVSQLVEEAKESLSDVEYYLAQAYSSMNEFKVVFNQICSIINKSE